jgi:hypothetical protein
MHYRQPNCTLLTDTVRRLKTIQLFATISFLNFFSFLACSNKWCHDTQDNNTQNNDIQNKNKNWTLSKTTRSIMQSVICAEFDVFILLI